MQLKCVQLVFWRHRRGRAARPRQQTICDRQRHIGPQVPPESSTFPAALLLTSGSSPHLPRQQLLRVARLAELERRAHARVGVWPVVPLQCIQLGGHHLQTAERKLKASDA